MVDNLSQVVTALNAVLDLAEDLADLVFDGVRTGGSLLESHKVGKELVVDECKKVVASEGLVVIDLTVFGFGCCPRLPSILFIEDVAVFLAFESGFVRFVLLQSVKVL